jgi:hypothetical protein
LRPSRGVQWPSSGARQRSSLLSGRRLRRYRHALDPVLETTRTRSTTAEHWRERWTAARLERSVEIQECFARMSRRQRAGGVP